MKRVLLVPDGMADEPLDELGGRTPLEAADTANMDALAAVGVIGLVRTIPAGMRAGSDVANLAVLGYDPAAVYTGRAPLEAASIGVDLAPGDIAYRCNFVTVEDGVMRDFTAGHIASDVAGGLVARLNQHLGGGPYEFFAGVSYRNLMVWRGGGETQCTPPHDILDQPVESHLPGGDVGVALRALMDDAREVIVGRSAASDIWLWGQGRAPSIPPFRRLRGLSGAVVGAVDLVKGIGRYAGFEIVAVPGATGDTDTDYAAKGHAALDALGRHDLVFVHVEAPDEAAHAGDADEKVRAIAAVDRDVLGPILASSTAPHVLVLPDHATPVRLRTHVEWPVPFVYGRAGVACATPARLPFCESAAAAAGRVLPSGAALMDEFIAAGA